MPLNLACLPKQLLEFGIPGVMCRLKHFQASLKVHFQLSFYGSFYKAKRTSIWCLSKSPAYYFDTHRLWFLLQKMPKLHFQVDSTYFPNKVEWRSGPDLSCQCSELGSFLRLFLNDLRTPGPKLAGLSRYPTVDSKLCRRGGGAPAVPITDANDDWEIMSHVEWTELSQIQIYNDRSFWRGLEKHTTHLIFWFLIKWIRGALL